MLDFPGLTGCRVRGLGRAWAERTPGHGQPGGLEISVPRRLCQLGGESLSCPGSEVLGAEGPGGRRWQLEEVLKRGGYEQKSCSGKGGSGFGECCQRIAGGSCLMRRAAFGEMCTGERPARRELSV